MLIENLEFNFDSKNVEMSAICENSAKPANESMICFQVELNANSKRIHKNALLKAEKYLLSEAELLRAIMDVDQDRTFEKFGFTHLTPYCIKQLGLSEDVAAIFVRVARKSGQVPALEQAIAQGNLSVSKAKVISAVVTSENQEIWIEKAKTLSKEKLEKEVAQASPNFARPERIKPVGENKYQLEFSLTEEEMKLFRRCQEVASQKLQKSLSLAELQMELMKCYLKHHDPLEKAQRAKERADKKSEPEKGPGKKVFDLPKDHAFDQSRDRSMNQSRDAESQTRGSGNNPRIKITAQVLHALHLRDRGCCQARLPDGSVCGQSKWVHVHHLKPVSEGGTDCLENLVTLCSGHHRLWHLNQS